MKKPITTNLFSFKTFRSPDKVDPTTLGSFLIEHPNLTLSIFNTCPVPTGRVNESNQAFTSFLDSFGAATNYKQIRDIDAEFYDFSSVLMLQKRNDSSKKPLEVELPRPLSDEAISKIWDELFYQVATQKTQTVRQACIQMILAQHYATNHTTLDLKDFAQLTIRIPSVVLECFKPWQFNLCGGKLYGVHNLGIQEYRRVEQTLCCYVPGEVSHIENVMAKEYKEKSTRNLLRTEYTTELTTETEIENINDTTSTERNEISTEIAKELQKDKSFDISGSVTYSKDSKVYGSITANVSTGYSSNNSSSQSNTEAKNYAKEVTERALERVVQKTSEKRTYKMIKEYEENNKHGFDNRNGDKHITGVYRWVDKIYDNQLVNYGKRLIFESDIPNPSAFYKKTLKWKSKDSEAAQNILIPPKTLAEFGINAWSDVTNESINSVLLDYSISIEPYSQSVLYKDVPFGKETEHKSNTKTDIQAAITVDTGYIADRLDGIGSFQHNGSNNTKAYLRINIANAEVYRGDYKSGQNQTDTFPINIDLSPNVVGSISFSVSYRQTRNYSGSFKVKMISDPALFRDWQEETLLALQTAYQGKLDAYNEELKLQQAALEAEKDQEENTKSTNPALNRIIEERELKRICIEMMSKPYCYDFGKNFNECKTYNCQSECGENEAVVPNIVQNEALEKYAKFIKFFETAFQWEILSYTFFPYYYNQKCDWSELLQLKNDDPIFEAFLQSGMAKLTVPVRPQFEKAVMFYMETGEIYLDGDLIPATADDRYESLLTDLGNQDEITVEGTWQTRVPSTLTIIQAKSTYYEDEKGLPCCDDSDEIFIGKEDTLQNINPV